MSNFKRKIIDFRNRSQPLDGSIFWNPNGYEWTGVFKVEVTVR
jgi:sulfite oxidase